MGFKSLIVASATLTLFQGVTAGVTRRWGIPAGPFCTDFTPFTYAGCFTDPAASGPRALPFISDIATSNMTAETCVSFCKGNNYRYAGIEYYGECYCGASVGGVQVADSNCNFPCTGNSSEACGGSYLLSVYQDPTFPTTPNPVIGSEFVPSGCYSEGSSGRSLVYPQSALNSSTMTVEICLASCKSNGYALAGVEFGGECYCGVVLGNGTAPVDSTQCNMACNGNSAETCGGPNRLNLYVAKDLESSQPCNFGGSSSSSSSTTTQSSTASSSSTSTSTSSTTTTTSSSTTTTTSTTTSSSTTSSTTSTTKTTTSTTSSSSTSSPMTTTTAPSTTSSTTMKTTTTTTSAALCTKTIAPTCEYQCGSWCSNPLPTWSSSSDCKTAASQCALQVAGCFLHSTYPDSMKCFEYSGWCQKVSSYCNSDSCAWGKCSKDDCTSKNPPSNPPSSPSTTIYPCPATTTKGSMPTTIAKPTTTTSTTVTVPTASNICVQAHNPDKGYSRDAPCGGIALPCLTCNNVKSEYDSGSCFKLYNSKDSSQCSSYKKPNISQGCKDACLAQYNSCVGTYAEDCKNNKENNGGSWGWGDKKKRSATWGWSGGWGSWGSQDGNGGDEYQTANNKCQNQYKDCLNQNSAVTIPSSRCNNFNSGWY